MSVTIKLESSLPKLTADMKRKAAALVKLTSLRVEARSKVLVMQPPKTGKVYRRAPITRKGKRFAKMGLKYIVKQGKKGTLDTTRHYIVGYKIHRASAPGQAPATDTGMLASSIQAQQETPLRAVVAVGAEYAEALELGGAHMAPRPFLGPAVEAERERWEATMKDILNGR